MPRHEPDRLLLPDFERLSTDENNRLGMRSFAAGQYFAAHEAWETCWKQAGQAPEAEGFKGLAQLAAGYVHLQRGNAHGARVLLRRAVGRLMGCGMDWQGLDVARLIDDAERAVAAVGVVGPDRSAPAD